MYPDVPPQIEVQIAMIAAQMVQEMMARQQQAQQAAQAQQEQQNPTGPSPQQADAEAMAEFQKKQQMKDAAFQADQQRKDAATAADVDRKDALAGLSPQLIKSAEEFIAKTGLTMSPRELAVLSKALGKPFTDVITALSRMMMGGQGGSQFKQAVEANVGDPRFM
jgi:hypothetical protein